MTHIEKLKAERAKIALRIESLTSRLEKLDEKIMEMENMEIIGIVREYGLSIEQLAEMVKILEKNPVAVIPEDKKQMEE